MGEAPPRGPSIPPVYLLVAGLLMGFFHLAFPLAVILRAPYTYAGLVLMVLAIALILWAAYLFHRARTGVVPFTPATFLVLGGPYKWTRNPMYLGMAGVLLGAGVFLGSITPFIVIPAFVALINERFIHAEEAMLEEAFGQSYLDYKKKVRRWL